MLECAAGKRSLRVRFRSPNHEIVKAPVTSRIDLGRRQVDQIAICVERVKQSDLIGAHGRLNASQRFLGEAEHRFHRIIVPAKSYGAERRVVPAALIREVSVIVHLLLHPRYVRPLDSVWVLAMTRPVIKAALQRAHQRIVGTVAQLTDFVAAESLVLDLKMRSDEKFGRQLLDRKPDGLRSIDEAPIVYGPISFATTRGKQLGWSRVIEAAARFCLGHYGGPVGSLHRQRGLATRELKTHLRQR